MAIKGAQAKEQVIQEILNYFGDRAFKYDKDIRVNCMENGELVQIKLAFTAAKVAVEKDGDTALPAATAIPKAERIEFGAPATPTATVTEPTREEKETVAALLAKLGL